MSTQFDSDLSNLSMLDLFRMEVEGQAATLTEGLLALEESPDAARLEALMRAAHSVKGAARMVDIAPAVRIAHAMEDCFVAAQSGSIALQAEHVDVLLKGVDMVTRIAQLNESEARAWLEERANRIDTLVSSIQALLSANPQSGAGPAVPLPPKDAPTAKSMVMADASMMDLFRIEVEAQTAILTEGLLALEQDPRDAVQLEALMRAAHSIKGAARMVDVHPAVKVAHAMEDCFVAAQHGKIELNAQSIDVQLQGVDLLTRISQLAEHEAAEWMTENLNTLEKLIADLNTVTVGGTPAGGESKPATATTTAESVAPAEKTDAAPRANTTRDTAIRVSAESLNRLMGLAGEVQVESRWLRPFAESLVHIKHRQAELVAVLDKLWDSLECFKLDEYSGNLLDEAQHKANQCRSQMSDRLTELEEFDRRSANLSSRLNREVINSRMRPFADGVHGFQRMVRDMARSINKNVKLEIRGLNTKVDRDILEKIEAPLNHLVRNAIDHGIETPEERAASGKPGQAVIRIDATHSSGMLSLTVEDDGRGIDPEKLRRKVVEKNLVTAEMAADLSDAELTEFLFLPGFSTRDEVSEISGRGVGLDVVHTVVQEMRGVARATSELGKGTRFHMQLPLTLSVIRSLLVEISGDPYAFPLARIDRTLRLHRDSIQTMENRQYFTLGNQHIGLVSASQILELDDDEPESDELSIVVLGERLNRYGMVVDAFLGERNLVVQTMDPRLGKIRDISTAAILENGVPCLIVDVDDLLRSTDVLVAGRRLDKVGRKSADAGAKGGKRVLVVDDSITVREMERKLLAARGYEVEVAVDGMDGWNAVRTGHYDLVISDIDMPRMNGFEFVGLIKQDNDLRKTPVMIVSYKDREEDRKRGLEVGADYYLTKGSFHDETLIDAVVDLIGTA